MVGRAIGRGEVSPDVDPAIVLHMMLSPAVSVSLFEGRAMTESEIDSLVTLVCRATAHTSGTAPRRPSNPKRTVGDVASAVPPSTPRSASDKRSRGATKRPTAAKA
jgi:hypothetical protein